MIMQNIYLDVESLGKQMMLVAVTPDMYLNGQKVAEPVGYRYDVCLRAHGMDKLSVRIPGAQLIEAPTPEQDLYVRFDGLRVRPYVGSNGRLAFTAHATGIHAVTTGSNTSQVKS